VTIRRILILALSYALLLAALPGAMAATNEGAAAQVFWNSPGQALSVENNDPKLAATRLLLTEGTQTKPVNEQMYGGVGFYMCGDYAVYYARNAKGKSKWFTYNMKAAAKKEYAYDYLAPFWADSNYVYTTAGGKRVYDYNVFQFDPKTGKKAKLAAVYGMPIGYVGKQLIALDFYHKQLCYYEGGKLASKLPAKMLSGFIVNGTIYLILSDGVYRVDGGNLTNVIGSYMGVQACFNGSAFLYHSGSNYPREAYLVTPEGVQKIGTAKDEAAMRQLQQNAIELYQVK